MNTNGYVSTTKSLPMLYRHTSNRNGYEPKKVDIKEVKGNREVNYRGWRHSLAGAGAGLVASVVTCPLDLIKTRLQLQSNSANLGTSSSVYRGTLNSLSKIFHQENGIRGLYRGLSPTMMGYLPSWAIYFATYDKFKREIATNWGLKKNSPIVHMGSATLAGCLSTVFTAPLWVVKTRIMTMTLNDSYRYRSISHAFRTIFQVEGYKGFFKGLVPSLIGVSHVIVQFPLYEGLKRHFSKLSNANKIKGTNQINKSSILAASTLSIMAASLCTYPHEVVRTRLQAQVKPPFKYNGILGSCKVILREEGAKGLYKGFSTNLIRIVPCSSLTLLTYETLCRQLSNFL